MEFNYGGKIMSRTINGKTWKDIMNELEKDFPEECIQIRDYDKVPYISVDDMRERFDSVLGIEHYSEIYRTKSVEKVRDTYVVTVQGRIEILDDNFEVMFVKESSGSSTITFPNVKRRNDAGKNENVLDENGANVTMSTTTSFANDCKAAEQDAFKRIMKTCFHIGLKQLLEKKTGPVYEVVVTANSNTGSPNLYIPIKSKDTAATQLVVFKSKKEDFLKALNGQVSKNQVLHVSGQEQQYNGKLQVVFDKMAKPSAKEPSKVTETAKEASNKASQVQEEWKCLTLISKTPVTERRNSPGDYSLTAYSEATGDVFNIVIKGEVKETIEKWDAFKAATEKADTKFTFYYVNGKEGETPVLYMRKFSA